MKALATQRARDDPLLAVILTFANTLPIVSVKMRASTWRSVPPKGDLLWTMAAIA